MDRLLEKKQKTEIEMLLRCITESLSLRNYLSINSNELICTGLQQIFFLNAIEFKNPLQFGCVLHKTKP